MAYMDLLKEQAFRVALAKLKHSWDEYEMESDTFGRMFHKMILKENPTVNVIGAGSPTPHKYSFDHNGVLKEVPLNGDNTDS